MGNTDNPANVVNTPVSAYIFGMSLPIIGITLDSEQPGGYAKLPWYALRENYCDSVARAGPYRMDDFVRQLTALLDHLDIEHCHLVGFSLGGLIVQAFAVAHGNRVDRLAILNAGFDRSAEERAGMIERLQVALDNGHGATVAGALKRWFTPDFAARRPDVIERVRLWMEANDANIYPEIYRVLAYGDQALAGTISTIQAPTLVLTCSDDSGSPPAMVARMARAMPHAELAIVAGLKHMGLMEDPPAINNILMPFLIG